MGKRFWTTQVLLLAPCWTIIVMLWIDDTVNWAHSPIFRIFSILFVLWKTEWRQPLLESTSSCWPVHDWICVWTVGPKEPAVNSREIDSTIIDHQFFLFLNLIFFRGVFRYSWEVFTLSSCNNIGFIWDWWFAPRTYRCSLSSSLSWCFTPWIFIFFPSRILW